VDASGVSMKKRGWGDIKKIEGGDQGGEGGGRIDARVRWP